MNEIELSAYLLDDYSGLTFTSGSKRHILSHLKEKELLVSIKPLRSSRSASQNRYYWFLTSIVAAWVKETQGEDVTKEEIHVHNLHNIQGVKPKVKEFLGEEVIVFEEMRPSKMDTAEYNLFIEKFKQYYADKGLHLPEPEINQKLYGKSSI